MIVVTPCLVIVIVVLIVIIIIAIVILLGALQSSVVQGLTRFVDCCKIIE